MQYARISFMCQYFLVLDTYYFIYIIMFLYNREENIKCILWKLVGYFSTVIYAMRCVSL